ncbi:MAG: phosphotransferase [Acidobacteriota bacterium]
MGRPFEQLTPRGQVRRLRAVASVALARFGLPDAAFDKLDHFENTTFRVRGRPGYLLRLHRPGYQTPETIESELCWLDALDRDTDLRVPRPVTSPDGERVVLAQSDSGPESRACTLLQWMPGPVLGRRPVTADELAIIGELLARVHVHASSWTHPSGFRRRPFDWRSLLGEGTGYGDLDVAWSRLPKKHGSALRDRAEELRDELTTLSRASEHHGLIHGDLHRHNVIVLRGGHGIIDFDDCGAGWFLYDFASALHGWQSRPDYAEAREKLFEGYRRHRPLDDDQVRAELPVLLELRELSWLLWAADRAAEHRHFAEHLPEWCPIIAKRLKAGYW